MTAFCRRLKRRKERDPEMVQDNPVPLHNRKPMMTTLTGLMKKNQEEFPEGVLSLFQSRPRIVEEKPEKEEWERMRRNFRKGISDYQRSRRERRAYEAYVDQPEEDTLEYRLSQYFAAGIFMLIVLAIVKHLPVIKEATVDVHGLIPMIVWSYELTGFYGGIIYLIYRGVRHRLGGRKALFDIGLIFFGLGCGGLRDGSFVSAIILLAIGCGLFYASR